MKLARPLVPFAAVLAASLVAPAAAAQVRDVEILFSPEAPTWREPVTVTVRGEANCAVVGVTPSFGFELGVGPTIRLDLDLACIIDPPSFQPFEVSASLGRVEPGEYVVRVPDPAEPADVVAETELIVHDVADVEIVPPAAPTDEEPFTIAVSGFSAGCVSASPAEVEGNVITIVFPDECPVLPPGPSVVTHEFEVGPLPAGVYEVRVLRFDFSAPGIVPELAKATVEVFDDELCVPSPTALCLNDDRFRVSVEWADFFGGSGQGQAIPLRDDTGLFWFFHPDNVELTIKVLAACPVDGHHWVFVASGSTVEYTVTVTDTRTDESRTYDNALGEVPELIADTAAFDCP